MFALIFTPLKKITAIGLIFLMSVQCFYKLGVITYFHFNRAYIAETLCINKEQPITMCYGQCFLKMNLDLTDQSTTSDGITPAGKLQADFPDFLITQQFYPDFILFAPREVDFRKTEGTTADYSDTPFQPPTA